MAVWIDSVIQRPRLSAIWTRVVEPLLRFWPTYPPDWQLRRMLVFERAQLQLRRLGVRTAGHTSSSSRVSSGRFKATWALMLGLSTAACNETGGPPALSAAAPKVLFAAS